MRSILIICNRDSDSLYLDQGLSNDCADPLSFGNVKNFAQTGRRSTAFEAFYSIHGKVCSDEKIDWTASVLACKR
jgi:hypothetical protein